MKTWLYAQRNLKELLSDPLSLVFTIGLPAFLLVFMVQLNRNLVPIEAFRIENFLPATIVFSYSFLTMFVGLLVAKDRCSSFLARMYTSPLKAHHYILGYMIPVAIIALMQAAILYLIGLALGMPVSIHILASLPFLVFASLLFIALGVMAGSLLKDTQVGPIASILVQVVAFLSGMWFALDMVGGAFETIGRILPFSYAVDMIKYILSGDYASILLPVAVIGAYTFAALVAAVMIFKRHMKS